MEPIMISDAAKEVQVETHVLRYWEEELKLPIRRNKQGHRCYTKEDVERFKKIKLMKEQGLQLKAIKTAINAATEHTEIIMPPILIQPEMVEERKVVSVVGTQAEGLQAKVERSMLQSSENVTKTVHTIGEEDKTIRLQMLLKQLIAETVRETNEELYDNIRQSLLKELDYQFRMQEEREEVREQERRERDEEYYKKMDELLRSKSKVKRIKKGFRFSNKKEKQEEVNEEKKELTE